MLHFKYFQNIYKYTLNIFCLKILPHNYLKRALEERVKAYFLETFVKVSGFFNLRKITLLVNCMHSSLLINTQIPLKNFNQIQTLDSGIHFYWLTDIFCRISGSFGSFFVTLTFLHWGFKPGLWAPNLTLIPYPHP